MNNDYYSHRFPNIAPGSQKEIGDHFMPLFEVGDEFISDGHTGTQSIDNRIPNYVTSFFSRRVLHKLNKYARNIFSYSLMIIKRSRQ